MAMLEPSFRPHLVEERRPDGGRIASVDVDGDVLVDLVGHGDVLVGHGLGRGEFTWHGGRVVVRTDDGPLGMHHADIDGDGFEDVVVCHPEGGTAGRRDPEGGRILWLQNPGPDQDGPWTAHPVGRASTLHRLRVGHFTQTERWEVLCLPAVGTSGSPPSALPVLLFTQPDDLVGATGWPSRVVGDAFYRMLPGATVTTCGAGAGLDAVLLASELGVAWLRYDPVSNEWRCEPVGAGERFDGSVTGFFGSGDVAVGRVGGDTTAYVAAVEPFRGSTVAVYTKIPGAVGARPRWQRHVFDVFGAPDGGDEGPGHFVVCADLDGDGDDEFLVVLRAAGPHHGVHYCKAEDLDSGVFRMWRVAEGAVDGIIVADLTGDGRLDFATVAHPPAGAAEDATPTVTVHCNDFAPLPSQAGDRAAREVRLPQQRTAMAPALPVP